VKPDFFGEDAEFVDQEDDLIIRAMEWLMLVPGLFVETCTYTIRIYKYLLSMYPSVPKLLHPQLLTGYRADTATRCPRF
jgi:hypothetical protein